MPITRVQNVSAVATSVTLSSVTAGDYIVVWTYNTASVIPTLAAGFTNIVSDNITGSGCRLAYKVAVGGETSSGTWTNSVHTVCLVYRGVTGFGTTPTPTSGSASTTLTYAAVTLQDTSGSSWVAAFGGANTASAGMNGTPTGTAPNLVSATSTVKANGLDTNTGISSNFTAQTLNFTGSSAWHTVTIELKTSALFTQSYTPTFSPTATINRRTNDGGFVATLNNVAAINRKTTGSGFVASRSSSAVMNRRTNNGGFVASLGSSATFTRGAGKVFTASRSFVGAIARFFTAGGGTLFTQSFVAKLFGVAGPPDLLNEDFEGTGAPGGWTGAGPPDYDYSTTPLDGSQSLRVVAGNTANGPIFTASPEVWFKLLYKPESLPASNTILISLQNSSAVNILTMTLQTTGALAAGPLNSGTCLTSATMSAGTVYNIWCHYKNNGGPNNSLIEISFDTAGSTRPSSGTKYATNSTGTGTTDVAKWIIRASNITSVFDNVQVASTDVFGEAVGPSASFNVRANKNFAAVCSFFWIYPNLVRTTLHSVDATVSFLGAIRRKITDAGLNVTLSFAGVLNRSTHDSGFFATLLHAGTLARNVSTGAITYLVNFSATLFTSAGSQVTQSLNAVASFTANLVGTYVPSGGMLVDNTFEGVGAPPGWIGSAGADFDYVGAGLVGSQALMVPIGDYANSPTFDVPEAWFKFFCKLDVIPISNSNLCSLVNAAATDVFTVNIAPTGKLIIGPVPSGVFTTVNGMLADTTYIVWGHYKNNGGTNTATLEVSFSVPGNPRPNSGDNWCGVTNGTGKTNAAKIQFKIAAIVRFYDNVQVASTDVF